MSRQTNLTVNLQVAVRLRKLFDSHPHIHKLTDEGLSYTVKLLLTIWYQVISACGWLGSLDFQQFFNISLSFVFLPFC